MHNKANNNYLHTMIFDNSSIKAIHESPYKFVISSSGGGTNAISALMGVPGASQSILESYVPYSRESLDIHLNKKPDHYCSQATSLHMASLAYKKALSNFGAIRIIFLLFVYSYHFVKYDSAVLDAP